MPRLASINARNMDGFGIYGFIMLTTAKRSST